MNITETSFKGTAIQQFLDWEPKPYVEMVLIPPYPENYYEPWPSFRVRIDSPVEEFHKEVFTTSYKAPWMDNDTCGLYTYHLPDIPPYRIVASEGIPPVLRRLAENDIFQLCDIAKNVERFGVPFVLFELNRKAFYKGVAFEDAYCGSYRTKQEWVDSFISNETSCVRGGFDFLQYCSIDYDAFLRSVEESEQYMFVEHEAVFHVFRLV